MLICTKNIGFELCRSENVAPTYPSTHIPPQWFWTPFTFAGRKDYMLDIGFDSLREDLQTFAVMIVARGSSWHKEERGHVYPSRRTSSFDVMSVAKTRDRTPLECYL